jgi:hypothetical protein
MDFVEAQYLGLGTTETNSGEALCWSMMLSNPFFPCYF